MMSNDGSICGLIAPSHRNMAERIKENALYGKLRHYYWQVVIIQQNLVNWIS